MFRPPSHVLVLAAWRPKRSAVFAGCHAVRTPAFSCETREAFASARAEATMCHPHTDAINVPVALRAMGQRSSSSASSVRRIGGWLPNAKITSASTGHCGLAGTVVVI